MDVQDGQDKLKKSATTPAFAHPSLIQGGEPENKILYILYIHVKHSCSFAPHIFKPAYIQSASMSLWRNGTAVEHF